MPVTTGKAETVAYLRQLPGRIRQKALPGAAQAAIDVIATEASTLVTSTRVRKALATDVRRRGTVVAASLTVEGSGFVRSLAGWLEYGTVGHFIGIDPKDTGGRSVRQTNDLGKKGTLVINGEPVGSYVWHPGSDKRPFLRESLDRKGAEALAAAQTFINSQVPALRRRGGGAE